MVRNKIRFGIFFDEAGIELDESNIVTGILRFRLGAINIAMLNTVAKGVERMQKHKCFLIVRFPSIGIGTDGPHMRLMAVLP